MNKNRELLGPLGPPSFSGSSRPILGLDWSATAGTTSTTKGAQEANPAPSAAESATKEAIRPESATRQPDDKTYADREWDRFLACAIPTPNGLGWYDPSEAPEMPSGVPGADWDAFVADCGNLGRGKMA
ncbi:MAG: hypothetical protein IID41_06750 [Planctomycetes bacterium]|nr:hypothetical protein [Planctomycetota bacterium]